MKPRAHSAVRLLAAVLLFCGAARAEVREWRTAEGDRTIQAEYVKSDDGSVTIRRSPDARIFTIPLETLSEDDREWVAKQEEAAEEAALRESPDNAFMKLVTGEWERDENRDLKYRFYGGKRLRRSGESGHPLLIYLHGRGGDVMTPDAPWDASRFSAEENYRKRPCFILVPQCPPEGSWNGGNADAVVELVEDLVKHLPIDKNRIYLTGFSMGGYGTFHLLAQEPKLFAAAVPVAGGGNPGTAGDFKRVPVWIFHGAKDTDVDVTQSRKMAEALEDARGIVKYTEYPEDGHGIIGKVYSDPELHEWLFAQSRK